MLRLAIIIVVAVVVIIAIPELALTAVGHANRLILNENWIDHCHNLETQQVSAAVGSETALAVLQASKELYLRE